MNKKILFTLLIAIITFTSTACQSDNSKIESNTKAEKVIDEIKEEEIMEEFKNLDKETLLEVASFTEENIEALSKDNADDLILYFIKRSKIDLLNANSNLIDQKLKSIFGINFGPHAVDDGIEYGVSLTRDKKELALSNLSRDNDKNYITEVFSKAQTINQYEGEYFLIIDYNYLYTKYADQVSSSLSDYLSIMKRETITPLTNGDYLAVPLDELEKRIVNYENFLTNSADTSYRADIRNLYSTALWKVLGTFTYFNDFTDDYKLKGVRLDYYSKLKDLDNSPIMTSAVKELYDFFYSDTNGLSELNVDADKIIYNMEKDIHSASMLKIDVESK